MKLGETQQFASPGEALKQRDGETLEHHGVKGMRWGVRKKDDTGGKDAVERNAALKVAMTPTLNKGSLKVESIPTVKIGKSSTPKIKKADESAPLEDPALSEKQQKRVDKFLKRADVANVKISEIKRANAELEGSNNPAKAYTRYVNNETLRDLDKHQKQALKDAEAAKKGKLTSTQKKMIVGAVGVSAILAGVAISRGQQSGALNSYALRGAAALRGQKSPFAVNKGLSGKMSRDELLSKVVKPVNPGYSSPGGKMNCRRSTYAYELRRRGFDVHATTSAVGWGQSESGVINAVTPGSRNLYRRMSVSQAVVTTGMSSVARGDERTSPLKKIVLDKLDSGGPNGETSFFGSKKVFEELGKQPEGARGEVLFKFSSFGHSMAYEVINGKPHIFDSQKGTYHDLNKTVENKWGSFSGAEITRLDNANLDLNFLSRWATNVGAK